MYVRSSSVRSSSSLAALQGEEQTRTLCLSMPWFLGSIFGACREAYANTAADIYDVGMYGGIAPKPPMPTKPDQTAAETIAAVNARIAKEEAKGYHPAAPSLPGLTAQQISNDVDQTVDDAVNVYIPYAIAAGAVVLALALRR